MLERLMVATDIGFLSTAPSEDPSAPTMIRFPVPQLAVQGEGREVSARPEVTILGFETAG
jgi:hypothetical protein